MCVANAIAIIAIIVATFHAKPQIATQIWRWSQSQALTNDSRLHHLGLKKV